MGRSGGFSSCPTQGEQLNLNVPGDDLRAEIRKIRGGPVLAILRPWLDIQVREMGWQAHRLGSLGWGRA